MKGLIAGVMLESSISILLNGFFAFKNYVAPNYVDDICFGQEAVALNTQRRKDSILIFSDPQSSNDRPRSGTEATNVPIGFFLLFDTRTCCWKGKGEKSQYRVSGNDVSNLLLTSSSNNSKVI